VASAVYICATCDEAAYRFQESRAAEERAKRVEAAIRASGLPKDYRTGVRTIAHARGVGDLLQLCERLGTNSVRGLYIYGESRAYKTTVAAGWLTQEIKNEKRGIFVAVVDLFTALLDSYNDRGTESREEIVTRLSTIPMLVLDDFAQERPSAHVAEVLWQILDRRCREWSPGQWLIVTSNRSVDVACARFADRETGEAIRHRLAQLTVAVGMEESL
jgi:DNA replication protein DnaC